MLKIIDLDQCPVKPMENGRGETLRLVNTDIGTEKIDLHLNRLVPGGPRGKVHRHGTVGSHGKVASRSKARSLRGPSGGRRGERGCREPGRRRAGQAQPAGAL